MRCLTHITLVTVIQFIACYLASWGNAETIFMLFFHSTMAGTVYMVVLSNTEKTEMCRMSLSLVKAFGI